MTKNSTDRAAEIAAAAVSAVLSTNIEFIKGEIAEINKKLDEQYVTQAEFKPVRTIIYGMVGAILIAFIGGLIVLVLK